MRLAVCYNIFFDSIELLPYSMDRLRNHVDDIILVWQKTSNRGYTAPEYDIITDVIKDTVFPNTKFHFIEFVPDLKLKPSANERNKRNLGLKKAKELGCTLFASMDCDEIYENFPKAKQEYINSGKNASVCEIYTYFKEPTLRFKNVDGYYVPFIFKIRPDSDLGNYEIGYYADPTRKPNETDVVLISEKMNHYSYVRKDITLKLNNSSAYANIAKSNIFRDYQNAKEGYVVKDFFNQELIKVENIFQIEL